MSHDQREAWLERGFPYIRAHFKAAGYEVPENIRVSTGWPSKSALGKKKQRIGECWDAKAATDAHFHIFISPTLDKPEKVLGTLVHEVAHAVVGIKAGHKRPFIECAKAVGLVKPWTATTETDELKAEMRRWAERMGPYPHGAIKPSAMKNETEKGRMLLMECGCGLKIRTTKKWIETYGRRWPCPCGAKLVAADLEDGKE